MEKVRQAMELAIQQQWQHGPRREEGPPPLSPTARPPARQSPASPAARPPPSSTATRPTARQPASLDQSRKRKPVARTGLERRLIPVSEETLAANRLVAGIKSSAQREHYCLLQETLCEKLKSGGATRVGVTGPSASGKTLTAANLAMILALEARRQVLLLDLDLANPSIRGLFNVNDQPGIEDVLFRGVGLNEALFSPGIETLTVLGASGNSEASRQMLHSPALKELLAEVAEQSENALLIADLPPISSSDDAQAYKSIMDAFLLVIEDGVTREAEYRAALHALEKSNLIGTVLNNAELPVS